MSRILPSRQRSSAASHRLAASSRVSGSAGGMGNYNTLQLPSTMEVDIGNIYASNRYLPRNPTHQNALFRQIYRYDSTAGAAIELFSFMPWGDFSVVGIDDPTIRHAYEDSFTNIGLVERLPWLTVDYLTIGKMCTHLLFNEREGLWSDMIQHNPDYIQVTPVPLINQDPILHFRAPQQLRNLARNLINGGYTVEDPTLMSVLHKITAQNMVQLNSENTFYLPRRLGTDDYLGTSIYSRILQLVLLESALMNANLINAYRRSGPIRTISPAGDAKYAPEELDALALMFMEADEDPSGSTIVLKENVQIDTVDANGQNQWRAFDDWNTIQTAKLHALGFSESLISGEASYGTTDINLSVFLERVRNLRDLITRELVLRRICLNLAKAMDFRKSTQAELSHRIRSTKQVRNSDYIIPDINWNKSLSPVGNQSFLDALREAKDNGVPVSLRTWASACGVDFETEMSQLHQDSRDRDEIKKHKPDDDSDSMFATMQQFSEFTDVAPGSKREDSTYLEEFTGQVNPFNFQLLTPKEITRCLKVLENNPQDLKEQVPGLMYAAFQLYLKARGLPFSTLSEAEVQRITLEMERLEDDHSELVEFLRGKLKGISGEEIDEAVVEKMRETSLVHDDENLERRDVDLEMDDKLGMLRTETDYVGESKTKQMRKQMHERSRTDALEYEDRYEDTSEQVNQLDDRIKELIDKAREEEDAASQAESKLNTAIDKAGSNLGEGVKHMLKGASASLPQSIYLSAKLDQRLSNNLRARVRLLSQATVLIDAGRLAPSATFDLRILSKRLRASLDYQLDCLREANKLLAGKPDTSTAVPGVVATPVSKPEPVPAPRKNPYR